MGARDSRMLDSREDPLAQKSQTWIGDGAGLCGRVCVVYVSQILVPYLKRADAAAHERPRVGT